MEYAINGLNLVAAPPLAESTGWKIRQPPKGGCWLPSEMEFLFTGRAAFQKLEEIVAGLGRTAGDASDVVVVLLPQDLIVRKIEYSEGNTTFVCEGRVSGRAATISIPNGTPFGAFVEVAARRNHSRLVTKFVDRLLAARTGQIRIQSGNA